MTPDEVDRPQVVDDGWEQRLRDAVADTVRRRAEAAAWRREFAERRDHGLRARHAAKLARTHNNPEMPMNEIAYTSETGGEDHDAGPPHQWAIKVGDRYISGDRGNELNPVLTDLRGNSKRWLTYPDAAAALAHYRSKYGPAAELERINHPRKFR